jgi:hypothetical protein
MGVRIRHLVAVFVVGNQISPPLPRRTSPEDRRPSPEVVAELTTVMDQLEARLE